MKKFKKIIALGLAAIAAVSSMSISALAAEDRVVATFVDQNYETQSVTENDILAGNDTYTLFDGSEITFFLRDVDKLNGGIATLASDAYFSGGKAPASTSTPYQMKQNAYAAKTTTPAQAFRYSNDLLSNGTGSNVMLWVEPDGDISGTEYNVYRYLENGSPYKYLHVSPSTLAVGMRQSGCGNNQKSYVEINNYNRTIPATAYIEVYSY